MMLLRQLRGQPLVSFLILKIPLFISEIVFLFSAARNSQKGSYKDKRDLVTYDEVLF